MFGDSYTAFLSIEVEGERSYYEQDQIFKLGILEKALKLYLKQTLGMFEMNQKFSTRYAMFSRMAYYYFGRGYSWLHCRNKRPTFVYCKDLVMTMIGVVWRI